ncbi:MAG: hypothetical protein LBB63_01430 [Holosporaceae bacterium]|jgi:hypothetical protein|nr:hypothetical protein [Holosporaceae bacterium]
MKKKILMFAINFLFAVDCRGADPLEEFWNIVDKKTKLCGNVTKLQLMIECIGKHHTWCQNGNREDVIAGVAAPILDYSDMNNSYAGRMVQRLIVEIAVLFHRRENEVSLVLPMPSANQLHNETESGGNVLDHQSLTFVNSNFVTDLPGDVEGRDPAGNGNLNVLNNNNNSVNNDSNDRNANNSSVSDNVLIIVNNNDNNCVDVMNNNNNNVPTRDFVGSGTMFLSRSASNGPAISPGNAYSSAISSSENENNVFHELEHQMCSKLKFEDYASQSDDLNEPAINSCAQNPGSKLVKVESIGWWKRMFYRQPYCYLDSIPPATFKAADLPMNRLMRMLSQEDEAHVNENTSLVSRAVLVKLTPLLLTLSESLGTLDVAVDNTGQMIGFLRRFFGILVDLFDVNGNTVESYDKSIAALSKFLGDSVKVITKKSSKFHENYILGDKERDKHRTVLMAYRQANCDLDLMKGGSQVIQLQVGDKRLSRVLSGTQAVSLYKPLYNECSLDKYYNVLSVVESTVKKRKAAVEKVVSEHSAQSGGLAPVYMPLCDESKSSAADKKLKVVLQGIKVEAGLVLRNFWTSKMSFIDAMRHLTTLALEVKKREEENNNSNAKSCTNVDVGAKNDPLFQETKNILFTVVAAMSEPAVFVELLTIAKNASTESVIISELEANTPSSVDKIRASFVNTPGEDDREKETD